MIVQGLGTHGGMVTFGLGALLTTIGEILEELTRPIEEIRLWVLEALINQLQTEIMKDTCTKVELSAAVDSYQLDLDDFRSRIRELERRVNNIRKNRAE